MKLPSEIFGYHYLNHSRAAKDSRKNYKCPFVGSACNKQSRLIEYPFGVCSAQIESYDIALCPKRFLDKGLVLADVATKHFGTTNNILGFHEIGLSGIGSFDYVLVQHKPMSSEVVDFALVEFQTGQTTGTGGLVEGLSDFIEKGHFKKESYSFGVNYYDIWKRTFTQILNKGIIIEKWKKKIYWVVQTPVFDYFVKKYRIQTAKQNNSDCILFALYDLEREDQSLNLKLNRILSTTVDQLFNSFRKNDSIPPVELFKKKLSRKLSSEIETAIDLRMFVKGKNYQYPDKFRNSRVNEANDE